MTVGMWLQSEIKTLSNTPIYLCLNKSVTSFVTKYESGNVFTFILKNFDVNVNNSYYYSFKWELIYLEVEKIGYY